MDISDGKKARRKILPSLGGINKNYLRKPKILKLTLSFLANELDNLSEKSNPDVSPKIKAIQKDILKLSKYERYKKMDFYSLCQNIILNYNK